MNEKRFNTKFEVKGIDDCWEWEAGRDIDGYGRFWLKEKNNNVAAHRQALTYAGINVPDDKMVLHSCDNPPCVNPNHLSIGDNSQNQQEASDRGRFVNLTKFRTDYYRNMSDAEFQSWKKRFRGKTGKALSNLTTAMRARNDK